MFLKFLTRKCQKSDFLETKSSFWLALVIDSENLRLGEKKIKEKTGKTKNKNKNKTKKKQKTKKKKFLGINILYMIKVTI